jgi:hypothetical protein
VLLQSSGKKKKKKTALGMMVLFIVPLQHFSARPWACPVTGDGTMSVRNFKTLFEQKVSLRPQRRVDLVARCRHLIAPLLTTIRRPHRRS